MVIQKGQTEFLVKYLNTSKIFDTIQITAMIFAKLKADVNAVMKPEKVSGCVIAVPSYFTVSQQKSVLLAAGIAGLECISLIKETTATAINYSFYRKISTPFNVFFMDFGHTSLQIFACAFTEKKLKILFEGSELIGGRDIDETLAEHFIQVLNRPNATKENKSFCVGLLNEVEKLKIKMGANTDQLPLNIQHLLDDDNISLSMQRSEMEEKCAPLFTKIKELMEKCLKDSNLSVDDIHSIELTGGSSRIPKFKSIVEEVYGKAPIATMNQDEAVSRGAFLKSRMKTKKDFQIVEKLEMEQNKSDMEGLLEISKVVNLDL